MLLLRSLLAACLLFVCAAARAQALDAPVFVEIEACMPEARDEVMRLLRVELGARLQERPAPDALVVRLTCAEHAARVAAHAPGYAVRQRSLELASAPLELRPRIIALQIAELVREPAEPLAPPSVLPAAAAPARPQPEPHASSRYELQLLALACAFEPDGRALWGAALAFDGGAGWLRLGVDAGLATRGDRSELGSDRILLGYLAPRATAELATRALRTQLGVGHALGFARIEAEHGTAESSPGSVSGVWLAPFVLADLGVPLAERFTLHARGRLGWVVVPVVGRIARGADVEVRGLWLHAELGLGMSFF